MTVYVQLVMSDGTKRTEAIAVNGETSFYRIRQEAVKSFDGSDLRVADVRVVEELWKAGTLPKQNQNSRSLIIMQKDGTISVLLPGWSPEDIMSPAGKIWWTLCDLPTVPDEFEGGD